ncbi:MAG: type II toxin-antitoxin system HicB family antitoxin [Chloroflexi bacterium]|nr:type II toxin-antitoxin system HicB family antitoxin [Chloroflexota bacterium]
MAKYVLQIRPLEEGGYLATSPVLQGFLVQAETVEKVLQLAPGVAQALVEAMRDKGVAPAEALQTVEAPFHVEVLLPL